MLPATTLVPRLAIGVAGFAVGASCTLMAFRNGQEAAGGPEGLFWGAAYASIVVGSWFLPSAARTVPRSYAAAAWALFALSTAFVLVNAIGYTAHVRDKGVGTARDQIHAHDIAQREYDRLAAELAAMKPNPRWAKTSGCTDVTVPQSDTYCSNVRRIQDELAKHQVTLAKPRPISADPQAERLSMVLLAAPETVADWLPIFFAIAMDLLASGLISMAFAPIRAASPKEAAPALEKPAWLSEAPMTVVPFGGRVDGRKLRHLPRRAANSN